MGSKTQNETRHHRITYVVLVKTSDSVFEIQNAKQTQNMNIFKIERKIQNTCM